MQQQQTISQSDCDMQWKVDFTQQLAMISSVAGPRSSKALPKAKSAPKKGHGHCLVVSCSSDPLQLSESQRNHYIWEVCSTNRTDALKTTTLAASTGQQKGLNFYPRQCATTRHTTNASKVEWIGLWSFASSAIFIWPFSNDYHFLSILTTFCSENASTTCRRQKMLFKSSVNPESCIFMLQE